MRRAKESDNILLFCTSTTALSFISSSAIVRSANCDQNLPSSTVSMYCVLDIIYSVFASVASSSPVGAGVALGRESKRSALSLYSA